MSKARDKKIETVEKISEKVKRAKALVLADYRGLTHRQLEGLRKSLKPLSAEFTVIKNTLLKRSLEGSGHKTESIEEATFQNPTAALFAYEDSISPIKELAKLIKTLKIPVIKFGIFEGKAMSASDITKLATLPPRDVIISQLIGQMKSPIYGLHRALSFNMQKLVLTLKAVEQTKAKPIS